MSWLGLVESGLAIRQGEAYRIPRGYPRQQDIRRKPYRSSLRAPTFSFSAEFSITSIAASSTKLEYPGVGQSEACGACLSDGWWGFCRFTVQGGMQWYVHPSRSQSSHRRTIAYNPPVHLTTHDVGFKVRVPELMEAVSNVGGFGILTTLTQPNQDALREATRKARRLADENIDVDITFLPSNNPPNYGECARVVEKV